MLPIVASFAAEPDEEEPEEVVVEAERPVDTATGRSLDRDAIAAFPARSADELLRAIPGLHLSSHGGNGKAFQFLVRGFDAEHGSDLLVTVDGVPLNEPSNVHGQGYLDLHFLPTVLVDGLDLVKGSYRAQDGDFGITGTADYTTGLAPEGLLLRSTLGTDRSGRETVAWRPRGRGEGTFLVAEAAGGIGVGDHRRYTQLRAAAGLDGAIGATRARASVFVYDGAFESPGVLRSDDLQLGEIGFYEAYPVVNGGRSQRALAIVSAHVPGERAGFDATAWAGGRALELDQDFTGWLRDPVHGDGTRQGQQGVDGGIRLHGLRLLDVLGQTWAVRVGADARRTAQTVQEAGLTPDGVVWEPRVDADERQADLGGWTELRALLGERITLVPGLRVDRLELAARERLDDGFAPVPSPDWANSGATVIAPRGTAAVRPVDPLTLFVAAGRGFRSPDARGIADGDQAPVMTSDSAETGARIEPIPEVTVSATGFSIVVSNELVFDHLAGRFLSAGRTRRLGLEGVLDVRPLPWLHLQADGTLTDGRFTATGDPIPYAPRWLVTGGTFLESAPVARGVRLVGGVRAWYLGERPLPSGFASRPAGVGSLTSELRTERLSVGVQVDNLFLGHWRDGEFVFPSWFDRTEPRSELKVLHVTPGDPTVARLTLGWQG